MRRELSSAMSTRSTRNPQPATRNPQLVTSARSRRDGIRTVRAQVVQAFGITGESYDCSSLVMHKANHEDAVEIVPLPAGHLIRITTGRLDGVFDKIIEILVFPCNENGYTGISRLRQFLLQT